MIKKKKYVEIKVTMVYLIHNRNWLETKLLVIFTKL